MSRKLNLPALVGSRICHDLISPLGAIGNGVELLEMSGMEISPEIALIQESAQAANARLRFFRVAYGNGGEGQIQTRSDISSTLASVARGGKLSYFWEVAGECDTRDVRVAFLILQCLERAMPYGGDIHIRRDEAAWSVVADADRLNVVADLWDSLTNPRLRPEIAAADVQFALLPDALRDCARTLRIDRAETRIALHF